MDCKKCMQDIIGEPHVFCNGSCNRRVFHTSCVGLRKEYLFLISASKSILWLCEECLIGFNTWKETPRGLDTPSNDLRSNSVDTDISELKIKVDAILTTLSQFTPPSSSSAPSDSSAIVPRHSTPVSSIGEPGKPNAYWDSSCAADQSTQGCELSDERNFALLLSNIDVTVSENAVQQMVCQCLGASSKAECKTVKRLVPKGTDCSMWDYISFKIVLNEKWKSLAMSSSTWPSGIKFREFVRLNRAWRPDV